MYYKMLSSASNHNTYTVEFYKYIEYIGPKATASASAAASNGSLDQLAPPLCLAYAGNARVMGFHAALRGRLQADSPLQEVEQEIMDTLRCLPQSLTTFSATKATETKVTAPSSVALLACLADVVSKAITTAWPSQAVNGRQPVRTATGAKVKDTISYSLVSKQSTSEPCLCYGGDLSIPILGTEFKSLTASVIATNAQTLHICGDTAMYLWHHHSLAQEDCVVPGLGVAGGCIQLYATYLLPQSYPCMVALSPVLDLAYIEDHQRIAKYLATLLHTLCVPLAYDIQHSLSRNLPVREEEKYCLSNVFLKPIICRRIAPKGDIDVMVGNVLITYRNYAILASSAAARPYVVFPYGMISLPRLKIDERSKILQLIPRDKQVRWEMYKYAGRLDVFPRLDGWSDGKPQEDYAKSYLEELSKAVTAFNDVCMWLYVCTILYVCMCM